jgi:hypothetical protein
MAKSASVAKGIFCLEGEWSEDLKDQSSVEHTLILLSKMLPYHTPYIHRNVATRAEFDHYVAKWCQAKYAAYPILYLAFHGTEGTIQFGDLRKAENVVTLDELERSLEGRCRGRIIYFSSCDTMGEHGNRLRSFLRRTDALAVCGYRRYVDWLTSMAFDLLFLRQAQYNAFTLAGARAIARRVKEEAAGLASRLGFHMMFNDG